MRFPRFQISGFLPQLLREWRCCWKRSHGCGEPLLNRALNRARNFGMHLKGESDKTGEGGLDYKIQNNQQFLIPNIYYI